MLEIDGDEGGGQLLRSSLALAAITERPVRIENVRGNRPEPGLKPQHLAALEAIAEVCDATVDGTTPGSEVVTFDPGSVRGGTVEVDVGTAGSATLVFDTVVPLAGALDESLSVTATGGTEVTWSPPLSFYRRVKLPLCRQFGLVAAVERHRTGFYPAGGGRATLQIGPSRFSPIALEARGEFVGARIDSRTSQDLADSDVARRQARQARERLDGAGVDVFEETVTAAATDSPGSAVLVELVYERTRAGFDALGEPGKPAERVADDAVDEALAFYGTDAAVDRHTADQLLVFLALAGGRLSVPEMTDHVESSLALFEQFGVDLTVDSSGRSSIISNEADRAGFLAPDGT